MARSWPHPGDDEPWLLKPCEVGRRLSLSRATVDRMLQRGEIPSLWVGGQRRVQAKDVLQWITDQAAKPKPAWIDNGAARAQEARAVARLRKLGVAK